MLAIATSRLQTLVLVMLPHYSTHLVDPFKS